MYDTDSRLKDGSNMNNQGLYINVQISTHKKTYKKIETDFIVMKAYNQRSGMRKAYELNHVNISSSGCNNLSILILFDQLEGV